MQEPESFTLDTHAIVKDMIAAGFTEKQAEVQVTTLTRFVRYNLATKEDVVKVERSIEELRKETKVEIEKLRSETKSEAGSIRKEIEVLKRDMTIRMGGIMVAGIAVLSAIKFFS